jgi:hypothetical protein
VLLCTTVQDTNGNNADFSVNSIDQNLGLQIGPAFVSGFGSVQTGDADTGQSVQLILVMSEPISVITAGGIPTLCLNDNEAATYDANESSPSSGVLVFDYTPASSDQTPDLALLTFNPNGAFFLDGNGIAVDFSAAQNLPTGLTINSPLTVASVVVSQIAQSAQFTLTMSESCVVNTIDGASPTLTLSDGTVATYDGNASNPSNDMLVFDDTLAPNEQASTLGITAVDLNGASIQDANGNNADFSAASEIAPCYCRGTLIRTDRGEVSVEALAMGDRVSTFNGEARAIKWIGRRQVVARYADPLRSL